MTNINKIIYLLSDITCIYPIYECVKNSLFILLNNHRLCIYYVQVREEIFN